MTTTSPATASNVVVPLQRHRQLLTLPPREHAPEQRGRHAGDKPEADVHAYWDAETRGLFTRDVLTQHGRRCGCPTCAPSTAAEVAS